MDLFNKFKDLVNETLLCKSYKKMTAAKRVLCIIALAPFIALYTCMLLAYWLIAIVYKFAADMLEYINAFVKSEGKDARHAAEAVIYLVAFPIVFAMKLMNAVIAFVMMIVHFFVSMVGYIATFGGIKFKPFIIDNAVRTKNASFTKHCQAALVVFMVIALLLLTLSLFFRHATLQFYGIYKSHTIHSTVFSEVTRVKNEELITASQWNDFVSKYNADGITPENYLEYEAAYLNHVAHETWNVESEATFVMIIELVHMAAVILYVLFTTIYVAAYSNAIRKKNPTPVVVGRIKPQA